MTDPIVEEVRKARAEHAARFGNDLHRIVADLKARQQRLGGRLVRLAPKPLSDKTLDRTH